MSRVCKPQINRSPHLFAIPKTYFQIFSLALCRQSCFTGAEEDRTELKKQENCGLRKLEILSLMLVHGRILMRVKMVGQNS